MRLKKTNIDPEKRAKLMAELRAQRTERAGTYRERALAMYPHVCGRCGREFSAKDLRELTVHHKDSNHNNNPPDGSNWELLCLYCHDDEHGAFDEMGHGVGAPPETPKEPPLGFSPFEGLGDLIKPETDKSGSES